MNSEADRESRRDLPSSRVELGRRIRQTAERIGTQAQAAAAAGISLSQLKRYISGESEAAVGAIGELAKAAGVSLHWLVYGENSPDMNPSKALQAVDEELLTACLEGVEEHLEERGLYLPPAKKALLCKELYAMVLEEQRESGQDVKPKEELIARFIRLAS